MALIKRFFYFIVLNFFIVITASIVGKIIVTFFGIEGELGFYVVFYSLIGFGGALISLSLSRVFAKKFMGVKVIDSKTQNSQERDLLDQVHQLAKQARLPEKPEVGIYESPQINAFATGPSKRRSLVAVSRGLLEQMSKEELDGVLAHEVAHIANGDMVTMTLLQGLINTMVLLAAHVLSKLIASQQRRHSYMLEFFIFIGLQIVFSILGTIFLCYFSRKREYKADKGGARLSSVQNMIMALKALQRNAQRQMPLKSQQESYNYLQISGAKKKINWFSTHPPLEDRIAKLERHLGI